MASNSNPADILIEESLAEYESKSLSELQSSIAKIDAEIHNNVSTHHNDLLAQSTNVELLDDVIVKTLSRTKSSLNSVHKLYMNVDDLYSDLDKSVNKLEHLYESRRQLAVFEQVLKYNELIDGERNLANVATFVANIESLCSTTKLDKLKPYREKALSLFQNIEKQTENILMQGLNAKAQAQVVSSLQILTNMNILKSKIVKITTETEKLIERDLKQCLKTIATIESSNRQSSASGNPNQPPGRAYNFKPNENQRKQVWSNLETTFAKIIGHTGKIKYMQHIMKTGKDLNSNYYFEAFGDVQIWTTFWDNVLQILTQTLGSVQIDFLRTLFEDRFPKLLAIINSFGTQLDDCTALSITVAIAPRVRGVVLNHEKAFLSKSLSKLFERVNYIFANSACPTKLEIDSLVQLIDKELDIEDATLKKLLNRNVSKTIQLVCHRAEQLISNEGAATQVIGASTEAQQSNATLVNLLSYFKSKIKTENSDPVNALMSNILTPLFQAIRDAIEAIVLTIHQENFKRTTRTTEYSLYMGELSTFLARTAKDYLSLFNPNDVVRKLSYQLSLGTIKVLVTNITLLNNLNTAIKKQLVIDLAFIEVALTPICPLNQEVLRFLRGFKKLLEMSPDEMKGSNVIGSIIPSSYVIHLLIMQTNGQIRAPHTINNWSIPRYLRWLEDQSESDKISLLRASLESYIQSVTSKGQTEFHPYYPAIMDLLRKSTDST